MCNFVQYVSHMFRRKYYKNKRMKFLLKSKLDRSERSTKTSNHGYSARSKRNNDQNFSIISEASSELRLLTKKHSLSGRKNRSFAKAKTDKDVVAFTAVIDSIDGIICTSTGRQGSIGQRSLPVFAVISYYKKVVTTGNTVKTNMLSLPLVKSTSSIGFRDRYYAKFSEDEEPQVFSLSAAMRKLKGSQSGYEPRELDFDISLMRGSEVVKIGSTTLVMKGDEDGSIQLLPVNTEKAVTNTLRKAMTANKPARTNMSSISTTGAKTISFIDDPTRKYTLQRSILRVSVHQTRNTPPSQYLQDPAHVPSSMMLSIGHSDSISCLSSGGVTTEVLKQKAPHHSQNIVGKNYNKLPSLRTASTDLDLSFSNTDVSSDSRTRSGDLNYMKHGLKLLDSEDNDLSIDDAIESYDSYGGDSTHIACFSSEETVSVRRTFSEDESTILDDVSIGTIKFKGIAPTDGFEIVTNMKGGKKMTRTVSDILG